MPQQSHIFEIEMPDGHVLEIEAPANTPQDQIRARAAQWQQERTGPRFRSPELNQLQSQLMQQPKPAVSQDPYETNTRVKELEAAIQMRQNQQKPLLTRAADKFGEGINTTSATSQMFNDPLGFAGSMAQMPLRAAQWGAEFALNTPLVVMRDIVTPLYNAASALPSSLDRMASDPLGTIAKGAGMAGGIGLDALITRGAGAANRALGLTDKLGSGMKHLAVDQQMRSLKLPTTMPLADRARITENTLKQQVLTTPRGAAKVERTLGVLDDKIQGAIDAGAGAGKTVWPSEVVASAESKIPWEYAESAFPDEHIGTFNKLRGEFLEPHTTPPGQTFVPAGTTGGVPYSVAKGVPAHERAIPVAQAQRTKVAEGWVLNAQNAFGGGDKLKTAEIAYKKALRSGLADKIAAVVPEVAGANAQESILRELQPFIDRAAARSQNAQNVGLGTTLAMDAAGTVTGSGSAGVTAGALRAILDNTALRSRLANAIYRHMPGNGETAKRLAAAMRVQAIINSLEQE